MSNPAMLPTRWASIHSANSLLSFSTSSGMRMSAYDPSGSTLHLPESSSDEALGAALVLSLEKSRVLTSNELQQFFALNERELVYEGWVKGLMAVHGERTTRSALFKNMKLCNVWVQGGQIHLKPTRKERGEAWSGKGISDEQVIQMAVGSSASLIGESIRKALAKCM